MTGRGREIGLGNAAWLELGLAALERGDIPTAVGALAAVDEAAWSLVQTRFPRLSGWARAVMEPDEMAPAEDGGDAIDALAVALGLIPQGTA